MDFKGPTSFICYRQIPVIANRRNEGKLVERTIAHRYTFVTGRFLLLVGLLGRVSTEFELDVFSMVQNYLNMFAYKAPCLQYDFFQMKQKMTT